MSSVDGHTSIHNNKKYTAAVRPDDILLGRGTGPAGRPGNAAFRDLIKETQDAYGAAVIRGEKTRIARRVIRSIHRNNGRFLRKLDPHEIPASIADTEALAKRRFDDVYLIIEDDYTLNQKVKQAFRHYMKQKRDGAAANSSNTSSAFINESAQIREFGSAPPASSWSESGCSADLVAMTATTPAFGTIAGAGTGLNLKPPALRSPAADQLPRLNSTQGGFSNVQSLLPPPGSPYLVQMLREISDAQIDSRRRLEELRLLRIAAVNGQITTGNIATARLMNSFASSSSMLSPPTSINAAATTRTIPSVPDARLSGFLQAAVGISSPPTRPALPAPLNITSNNAQPPHSLETNQDLLLQELLSLKEQQARFQRGHPPC